MSQNLLQHAAQLLREGRLVAFPTETVYGLGADATNSDAVKRIFAAKGRPSTNPLIVHIADARQATRYAAEWPEAADRLAHAFWPGPLTIVVPRQPIIAPEVSAGLNTVGLRCPRHPLALELLRAFDGPVAAPSANRSNRVSPTTAQHVRDEFGAAVDLILDGGTCDVGIESTVITLCRAVPTVLRPGAVTVAQLQQVLGPVDVASQILATTSAAPAPGQHSVHYSPQAPCYRFSAQQIPSLLEYLRHNADSEVILICISPMSFPSPRHHNVHMPADADAYARHLYAALRSADVRRPAGIFVELPPADAQWLAVHDRLGRAARAFKP